jgi:uncharacterized peroxidase-related enzyme
VQVHANDLRAEVKADWNTLNAASCPDEAGLDAFIHQIVDDWRQAGLPDALLLLAEFAEKVTRAPAACTEADITRLRAAGWSDEAIHDAVQVSAYFNYINRVAEALGVEVQREQPHWGTFET